MYNQFASVYDKLMQDVDYTAWAAYYAALLGENGKPGRRALDCACGTGNMTLALRGLGLTMTASDRSVEMLAAAYEKARKLGVGIPWINQDLRSINTHRPMDAVVCCCDGVNHLMTDAQVLKFLEGALGALRPGGTLAFDISSSYKLSEILGNNTFGEDRDDLCYIWINTFDQERRICQMDMTFFTKRADGAYDCFRETIIQKAHEAADICRLMDRAGFVGVHAYGGQTTDAPTAASERIHFVGRKSEYIYS
ncbi:MAG: class I SAM-dependent methyltransferase [Oscillospiraceae bacterium]|jgi:ubiquinone/menaquinone biosynthesis C-methylase UbiE|nr:class I SAM-dependent methyltransferase [Oscillospiraceae bacterium]